MKFFIQNILWKSTSRLVPHCHSFRTISRTSSHASTAKTATQVPRTSAIHSPVQTVIGDALFLERELNMSERLEHRSKELEDNVNRRAMNVNVQQLKEQYKAFKDLHDKKLQLERQRLENAEIVKLLVKEKNRNNENEKKELIERGKEIKIELRKLDHPFREIEREMLSATYHLPVDIHPNTPENDVLLIEGGVKPVSTQLFKDHMQLMKSSKSIQFRNEVGRGACYLADDLPLLERHLVNEISQYLGSNHLQQVICPDLVKSFLMNGTGDEDIPLTICEKSSSDGDSSAGGVSTAADRQSLSEKSADEYSLVLTGVSMQSLAAFLACTNVEEGSLPIKLFSVGSSYRQTRDSSERHDLFNTRQSVCADMFGATADAKRAEALLNSYCDIILSLYKKLDLPFRAVNVGVRDLKSMESRRIDLYLWSAGYNTYIRSGHLTMHDTYYSRRLTMKWSKDVKSMQHQNYLHTIYSRVLSIPTLIACLIEYNQVQDGTCRIPYPNLTSNS